MRKFLPVLCAWMILVAGACSGGVPSTETPQESIPTKAAETNSIAGIVENVEDVWPGKDLTLFAATFTGASESEGYFVLEPDLNPHTPVGVEGSFTLSDIPAGQYILLAGPTAEEARKLFLESGAATIIQIEDMQQIEIGSTFLPED